MKHSRFSLILIFYKNLRTMYCHWQLEYGQVVQVTGHVLCLHAKLHNLHSYIRHQYERAEFVL